MVAANKTISQVYEVLKRHIPKHKILTVLDELSQIPGNSSFTQTIRKLSDLHTSNFRLHEKPNVMAIMYDHDNREIKKQKD